MTQLRNTKKWETAAAGTAGIASFFTVQSPQKKWLRSPSPDRSLMSESEKICDIDLVICYAMIYWRLMMELLSPMVVMSEGLGFNLCVVPFLNVCVLNLPRRVGSRECQRWLEFGWRRRTRVGRRETRLGS